MKKCFALLALLVLFTFCQSPQPNEVQPMDSVDVDKDTLPKVEEDKLTSLPKPCTIDSLPVELKSFIKDWKNTERLMQYVDAGSMYVIDEGPGVYPEISTVHSIQDLLAKDEFIRFINTNYPAKSYYLQAAIDPCQLTVDGIYLNSATGRELLTPAYESYLRSRDETFSDSLRTYFENLDKSVKWQVTIQLRDKMDEVVFLRMALASRQNSVVLVAMDLTRCGI